VKSEKKCIFQWCLRSWIKPRRKQKNSVIIFHSIYSLKIQIGRKRWKEERKALKIKDKFQNWWLLCERRWAGQGSLHDGKTLQKWFIKNSLKLAREWRKGKNLCRSFIHIKNTQNFSLLQSQLSIFSHTKGNLFCVMYFFCMKGSFIFNICALLTYFS
jgi:hypothetical protein